MGLLSHERRRADKGNGGCIMHDTKGDLQNLLDASGHYLTRCLRVTRRDGVIYRVTDHDSLLSFPENWLDTTATDKVGSVQSYSPVDGLNASNSRGEGGLKKNNIEMNGALTGAFVNSDDIIAGLWDWAIVDDFICDWRYPFKGAFRWSKYRLTDFQFNDEVWTAQANSMTSELHRKSGKTYGDTCWHAFGDSHCGIDLNDAGVTEFHATISSLEASPEHNRTLNYSDGASPYDGASTKANEYFKAGHIRWTSGANKGQIYPIRKSTSTQIFLQYPTRADVATSDAFTLFAGCDKLLATCKDTTLAGGVNNKDNFGGFPFMVGTSKLFKTGQHDSD